MVEIEKDKQQWEKTSVIGLSKYIKMKALSQLIFPGKPFATFGLFLPGNRVVSQINALESKFDKIL